MKKYNDYIFIEIPKQLVTNKYNNSINKAIKENAFNIWDKNRIKKAFNFGNGSLKNFKEYMDNNSKFCYFIKIK